MCTPVSDCKQLWVQLSRLSIMLELPCPVDACRALLKRCCLCCCCVVIWTSMAVCIPFSKVGCLAYVMVPLHARTGTCQPWHSHQWLQSSPTMLSCYKGPNVRLLRGFSCNCWAHDHPANNSCMMVLKVQPEANVMEFCHAWLFTPAHVQAGERPCCLPAAK